MQEFNWDHQTLGVVHNALRTEKWLMAKYLRDAKARGMSVVDGYEQDIERLSKALTDVESALSPTD
jgi:hypothetical protein